MTTRRPIRRASRDRPPKHLAGTDGARDVRTDQAAEATDMIGEAIEEAGLVGLSGEPGLGKTHTVLTIAEQLAITCDYLEQRPGVQGKSLEIDMLNAIGVDHDPRDVRRDLQDLLVEVCATRRVFISDEADRASADGIDLVRYLWTQPTNMTAFILVGYRLDVLLATNPALDSRLERRVTFKPLDLEAGVAALRAYHPIFERAPEAMLIRAHAMTGGRFRLMAQLLKQILLEAGQAEPTLTRALLEAAWSGTGRSER